MPPRVARELFGLLATATPMTPVRAPAGRATTAAAATAIDDELIALRLDLQRDVTYIRTIPQRQALDPHRRGEEQAINLQVADRPTETCPHRTPSMLRGPPLPDRD